MLADLFHRRPDVAQINILAVASSWPSGSFDKILFDGAGERERDDQRRAHQEIRFDALVHARFEIAIAGKHAGRDQIMIGDDVFNRRIERPGISDAGRAAITHQIEAELIQIRLQARSSRDTQSPRASRAPDEVFTVGRTFNPCSTAFFASNPAASITLGFEVLVQEVIAAIKTSP